MYSSISSDFESGSDSELSMGTRQREILFLHFAHALSACISRINAFQSNG